jgi:hypothetical protein
LQRTLQSGPTLRRSGRMPGAVLSHRQCHGQHCRHRSRRATDDRPSQSASMRTPARLRQVTTNPRRTRPHPEMGRRRPDEMRWANPQVSPRVVAPWCDRSEMRGARWIRARTPWPYGEQPRRTARAVSPRRRRLARKCGRRDTFPHAAEPHDMIARPLRVGFGPTPMPHVDSFGQVGLYLRKAGTRSPRAARQPNHRSSQDTRSKPLRHRSDNTTDLLDRRPLPSSRFVSRPHCWRNLDLIQQVGRA